MRSNILENDDIELLNKDNLEESKNKKKKLSIYDNNT